MEVKGSLICAINNLICCIGVEPSAIFGWIPTCEGRPFECEAGLTQSTWRVCVEDRSKDSVVMSGGFSADERGTFEVTKDMEESTV